MTHWISTVVSVPALVVALLTPTHAADRTPAANQPKRDTPSPADSVLSALKAAVSSRIPNDGTKLVNAQLISSGWSQIGDVRWGTPKPVGSPELKAGQLFNYDYVLDPSISDAKADAVVHSFDLMMEEVREWSFSTKTNVFKEMKLNVDVKYPIGGVGQLHVSSEFKESVSTETNQSSSQRETFKWTQSEQVTVGPNHTAWGILTVSQQPFEIPWDVKMEATGKYFVTLYLGFGTPTPAIEAIRRQDPSFVCTGLGYNRCFGTIENLIPQQARSFVVEGIGRVSYGTKVSACTETVPLRQPSKVCTK